MDFEQAESRLLKLPAELIHHVLSYLKPSSLASASEVCHKLRDHALDDPLWQNHLRDFLPHLRLSAATSSASFRKQFLQHQPYWFIPKYKIWFSDLAYTGRLLIARYSARRQTIEAYALAAERGESKFEFWEWRPEVIIHTFEPEVKLDLNQPILRLDAETVTNLPLRQRISDELTMDTHGSFLAGGLTTKLLLTQSLAESAIGPGTQVWPPNTLPALSRTRNESHNAFRGMAHRPTLMSNMSEHAFRLRRQMDFTSRIQGMAIRFGEEVSTFATLPPSAYTPTKEKPWRGIWCGDYSGHGCEFLAILQPDEPVEIPAGAAPIFERWHRQPSTDSDGSWQTAQSSPPEDSVLDPTQEENDHLFESIHDLHMINEVPVPVWEEYGESSRVIRLEDGEAGQSHRGQLMAVKLTGDPNIPRGEYTFLAPDISDNGLLRIADEEIFKGARIVKSAGHIAARGYRDDIYIPSQLILISHDSIAQYWEAFGHISFYKRVDIDKFVDVD